MIIPDPEKSIHLGALYSSVCLVEDFYNLEGKKNSASKPKIKIYFFLPFLFRLSPSSFVVSVSCFSSSSSFYSSSSFSVSSSFSFRFFFFFSSSSSFHRSPVCVSLWLLPCQKLLSCFKPEHSVKKL